MSSTMFYWIFCTCLIHLEKQPQMQGHTYFQKYFSRKMSTTTICLTHKFLYSIVCKWEIIRYTVQIWKLFLEACIKISGLCCNNDFKRVFGRPIWVWRVNKSRVGALSHLSDRTGTIAGVHTVSYIVCGTLGRALKEDRGLRIRLISESDWYHILVINWLGNGGKHSKTLQSTGIWT